MPYSQAHKEESRVKILESARALFSLRGFDAVTVNEVMNNCSLTRGAFYAHFKSKADLYKAAIKYAAMNSELAKTKPSGKSSTAWLGELLDKYLSIEHVNGEQPCPLAFLSADIASRDSMTKAIYTDAYRNMNRMITSYLGIEPGHANDAVFSLTSMIIGAVAIARTVDDEKIVESILSSCRVRAKAIVAEL